MKLYLSAGGGWVRECLPAFAAYLPSIQVQTHNPKKHLGRSREHIKRTNMADCKNKIPITLKEPIEINDQWKYQISVPCGKCSSCIERRKMEWGFRMEYEMAKSKTAYFVTLTYDTANVPYDKYGNKVLVSTRDQDLKLWLHEKHRKRITKAFKRSIPDRSLQGFFKRLRSNQKRGDITIEHLQHGLCNDDQVRFYATGEYGSLRERPHFHAIIFNAARANIVKSWTLGTVHCVKANRYTIGYVMKYLDKHMNKKQAWNKPPEFNIMSEGIGLDYVKENTKWHNDNLDILFVMSKSGFRIPMPRYYRNAMFNELTRKHQVKIVEEALAAEKLEAINELGLDNYNDQQAMIRRYRQIKFAKSTSNRIID